MITGVLERTVRRAWDRKASTALPRERKERKKERERERESVCVCVAQSVQAPERTAR
jgi:hypothetical protein